MAREVADGGRSAGIAAGIERLAAENMFQLRREMGPRPHILRFLLAPDDGGAVVFVDEFCQAVAMEGKSCSTRTIAASVIWFFSR